MEKEGSPGDPAGVQDLTGADSSVSTSQRPDRDPRLTLCRPMRLELNTAGLGSGWQNEKPASRGRMLTTFTPSNEYNLTRLTPEEAAAYVEQLRREREKNGG